MTITNLKELSKLIDLCRKKGIDLIKVDNVELKLGHMERKKKPDYSPELQSLPDYTPEDILNWSSNLLDGVG